MVLRLGALLLSTICLTLAQESDNCECVSYFYCNATQYENDNCDGLYEVCCEITEVSPPSVDPTTEPSEISPTPTFSVVTSEPDTPPVEPPDLETPSELPLEQTPLASDSNLCGVRAKPSVYDWKVVTPDDSATGFAEFPWMVAVMSVDTAGRERFLCGGSVIYPNIVLTTAHNIRQFEARRLRVKAGVWNTNDEAEKSNHQVRFVQTRILHSGFNQTSAANDVGLLVLNENLRITNNVAPICLPSSLRRYNTENCIATGWGAENFGSGLVGGQLKMVQLPLIDFTVCQNRLRTIPKLGPNFVMHRSFICAGGDSRDTCTGDGGGPLICPLIDDPNRYVQVGVTSWGIGCGVNPGVYSSVSEAAEWIETMADAFPSAPEPTVPPRSRPFGRGIKNAHSKISC